MVVSTRCLGYYRLAPGETIRQEGGRCPHCSPEVKASSSPSHEDAVETTGEALQDSPSKVWR